MKAKGTIYLSNIRMVFVSNKPVEGVAAFDMPLVSKFCLGNYGALLIVIIKLGPKVAELIFQLIELDMCRYVFVHVYLFVGSVASS